MAGRGALYRRVERSGGDGISNPQLFAIARYGAAHEDDPRPNLLLGRIRTDKRHLTPALHDYALALRLDPTVRGDPSVVPDLLEMVRSEALEDEAGALFLEIFQEECLAHLHPAVLDGDIRRDEREHLEALLERCVAAHGDAVDAPASDAP